MSAPEQTKRTLRIACDDVVPGCGFTGSGDTEEEVIDKVAAHAAHDHGVCEITPELAARIKAAIARR
jgi:predicted small metal-binding protein